MHAPPEDTFRQHERALRALKASSVRRPRTVPPGRNRERDLATRFSWARAITPRGAVPGMEARSQTHAEYAFARGSLARWPQSFGLPLDASFRPFAGTRHGRFLTRCSQLPVERAKDVAGVEACVTRAVLRLRAAPTKLFPVNRVARDCQRTNRAAVGVRRRPRSRPDVDASDRGVAPLCSEV